MFFDYYHCQIIPNHLQLGWGDEMKNRLKELRARDGLNQTELAKKAKISRQTISLIERNEYMPSLLIATKIAHVFHEPIDQIFIFEEEELQWYF